MGISGGPYITRDSSLVLELDAADKNSYPGSGTTWSDLSGNNNIGTLVNGPTFNSINNGSIIFDGVDDYASLSTITVNSNFTISTFIKYTVSSIGNVLTILAGNNVNYLQIRIYNELVQIVNSTIADIGSFTNSTVLIDTIYNICISRNANNYDCYINGEYKSSLSSATTFTITNPYLGKSITSELFKGNIYNFINYNRALSASEVLENYNAQKSRFGL